MQFLRDPLAVSGRHGARVFALQPSVHRGLASVPFAASVLAHPVKLLRDQHHSPATANQTASRLLTTNSKYHIPAASPSKQSRSAAASSQRKASPASAATTAIPDEAMAWFKKHNHKPRTTDLTREFFKVLGKLGLNGRADNLTGEQQEQRKRLKAEFSTAAAISFAKKSKGLVFLQQLCERYEVKVGATQDQCIEELDKLYVNIHDAVLRNNNRQFATREEFMEDVKRRTFPKESAKQLGLRVFLKHVWGE